MNLLRFYRLKSRSLIVKTTQTTVLHININVKQCVQSNSFSGSLSLIIDHGPESPGVARSAPKKRTLDSTDVEPKSLLVDLLYNFVYVCLG
jgi:hypothetical protein